MMMGFVTNTAPKTCFHQSFKMSERAQIQKVLEAAGKPFNVNGIMKPSTANLDYLSEINKPKTKYLLHSTVIAFEKQNITLVLIHFNFFIVLLSGLTGFSNWIWIRKKQILLWSFSVQIWKLQRTAMHYACRFGHIKVVSFLIACNLDVNSTDILGVRKKVKIFLHFTQSFFFSGGNFTNTMTTRLSNSFLPWFCQTPLHMACLGGHSSIVQLLLENGASLNTKNVICWIYFIFMGGGT